jgi:hypothetical protein
MIENLENEEWKGVKFRTILKEKPEFPKKKKFVYLDKYEDQMGDLKAEVAGIQKSIDKLYHFGVVISSVIVLYAIYKLVLLLH